MYEGQKYAANKDANLLLLMQGCCSVEVRPHRSLCLSVSLPFSLPLSLPPSPTPALPPVHARLLEKHVSCTHVHEGPGSHRKVCGPTAMTISFTPVSPAMRHNKHGATSEKSADTAELNHGWIVRNAGSCVMPQPTMLHTASFPFAKAKARSPGSRCNSNRYTCYLSGV